MIDRKLSDYKIKKIIKCFCEDIPASKAAGILGINRNTINRYYNLFRELILKHQQQQAGNTSGEFECDESYFGAKRVRGKRGRGAAGKTPVFGILKRGGNVFVQIVKNCSKDSLIPIIQGKILEGSTVYTDGWKAYDGLILNGYDRYRIFHHDNQFARGKNHVNGIESFWSFAKRRLNQFHGLASHKFFLHIKECEWRFNNRGKNLFSSLWNLVKLNLC